MNTKTSKLQVFAACCCCIAFACLASTAPATTILSENFEGTSPMNPTTNINPGNPVPGSLATVVDPTFSPPDDAFQNYVEVLFPGIFAFSTKSVDLNTVGIQFTLTVTALEPLLTLSFDYGVDQANTRGAIAQFLDSTTGLQVGPTISSPPVTTTTASFTSAPFLLPPGTYNLQFASNTFSDSRGTQLDNIVLTSSVPEASTFSLLGVAALVFLGCRRWMWRASL